MQIFILGRTEYLYETAVKLSEDHTICGIVTAEEQLLSLQKRLQEHGVR